MDHPLPWLKYVDAGDLDDDRVDFDGLDVESPTGEHLGEVDGFIVDAANGRPYYVVVDAGGWFKSKDYLLPIGEARLDLDREVLVADLSRDRIERFPGFDKDEFERLDEDGIRRFNDDTSLALSGGRQVYGSTDHFSAAWSRPEFRHPDWWQSTTFTSDRLRDPATRPDVSTRVSTPALADLTRPVDRSADIRASAATRDAVIGRDDTSPLDRDRMADLATDRPRDIDPSPHYDGRAQPGDVLGLETGGESTHVGETAEDENKRRRDAEDDLRKERD